MPLGILFWVLWVVALLFGFAFHGGYVSGVWGFGSQLLEAVLFGILGGKSLDRWSNDEPCVSRAGNAIALLAGVRSRQWRTWRRTRRSQWRRSWS